MGNNPGHDDLPGGLYVRQILNGFHVIRKYRVIPPGQPLHHLGHLHAGPQPLGVGEALIEAALRAALRLVGKTEGVLALSCAFYNVVEGNGHPVQL